MSDRDRKLNFIYLPFLLCCLLVISGYSAARWLLDIYLGLFTFKTIWLDFVFPGILSVLVFIIFLRKRLKVLLLGYKQEQFAQLLAIATMFVPTLILQGYIIEQSKTLYDIESVSDIKKVRMTDCFRIKNVDIFKSFAIRNASHHSSGSHNEYLYFDVYVIAPFIDETGTFEGNNHRFWYGYRKRERMSNRADDEEKNTAYRRFQEKTWEDFQRHNFREHTYLSVVNYSDHRSNYVEALRSAYKNINPDTIVILEPEKETFSNGKPGSLLWVFISFGIGSIIFGGIVFSSMMSASAYGQVKNKGELEKDDLKDVVRFLTFRTPYRATPLLINLNIVVFLVLLFCGVNMFAPTGAEFLQWGGIRSTEFLAGEYWRLGTSMFVHAGIIHLILNCFGLAFIGLIVEERVGAIRFILIYLLSGIGGSIAGMWWNPDIISVGASGGVFGLIGLMAALCFKKGDNNMKGCYLLFILGYGGVSIVEGLITPGIDNAAHIGGLITGVAVSFLLTTGMKRRGSSSW